MNKPKQIPLFDEAENRTQRQVEYVAPEPKSVDQFARDVCDRLTQAGVLPGDDSEVANGFSAFLNLVAQVKARNLNQQYGVKQEV